MQPVTRTDYRQTLNNRLQKEYRGDPCHHLRWETSREGPDNQPTWQAIAYLHDIEWGRGKGPSRGSAMEVAAKNVLAALEEQTREGEEGVKGHERREGLTGSISA